MSYNQPTSQPPSLPIHYQMTPSPTPTVKPQPIDEGYKYNEKTGITTKIYSSIQKKNFFFFYKMINVKNDI